MKVLSMDSRFTTAQEVSSLFSTMPSCTEAVNTMAYTISKYCVGPWGNRDVNKLEWQFKQMGLFPIEICQLLDLVPKTLLELQLIIEEMEDRYDLAALEKILEILRIGDKKNGVN